MDREHDEPRRSVARLIVPAVLAVAIVGAVAAMSTSSTGCGDNQPPDAGAVDSAPDTPVV